MSKKINNIEFILENCEVIQVPIEAIVLFNIDNFYTSRCIPKYIDEQSCEIEETNTITKFSCLINQNDKIINTFTWEGNTTKPINRINQYNDICHIHINYEDNTEEEYQVKWWGDNPNYSLGQNTYFDKFGRLHIDIRKPRKQSIKEGKNV